MPDFNGTGPKGRGPGAGRGRGPGGAGLRNSSGGGRGQRLCGRDWGQSASISLGGPPRWGNGPWGFGISMSGRRSGYASALDEVMALREIEAYLQDELAAIQKRLAELESQS
jgi:hypothetical protein